MQIDRLITSLSVNNDSDLARYLDKGRSVVGSWRARKQVPMPVLKQAAEDKGVSLEWLLTGEGAMYRQVGSAYANNARVGDTMRAQQREADLIYIPEFNVQLSAGGGAYPEEHALAINNRAFSTRWLQNKGLTIKNLALVRVMGDSMEPLLKDKDMVMIDQSKTIPSDAMPYAVRLGGVLYIKLVQMRGQLLRLVSVNKAYDPIEIDLADQGEDAEVIGAIVWHAHSWV